MMSPQEVWNWTLDAIRQLFTTPIAQWTWGQWFLMFVLLSLLSSCCGGSICCCTSRRRRRRRRNSHYYRDEGRDGVGYQAYKVNRKQKADEDATKTAAATTKTTATTTPYRLA